MSEIKSTRQFIQQQAEKATSHGFMSLVTKIVVSRTRLAGTDVYEYCPYCVRKAKVMGQDYKTSLPLMRVTYKCLYRIDSNTGRIRYESEWQCSSCKDGNGNARIITTEDFIKFYVDKTPYKNQDVKLDTESIRKAGFINYGM